MVADVGKVYPSEIHLLKKELEVQGEILNQERQERKKEIQALQLELQKELDQLKRKPKSGTWILLLSLVLGYFFIRESRNWKLFRI